MSHHDAFLALQICDTKLLDAARRGKKEIVKALVKIKANVNCKAKVKKKEILKCVLVNPGYMLMSGC